MLAWSKNIVKRLALISHYYSLKSVERKQGEKMPYALPRSLLTLRRGHAILAKQFFVERPLAHKAFVCWLTGAK